MASRMPCRAFFVPPSSCPLTAHHSLPTDHLVDEGRGRPRLNALTGILRSSTSWGPEDGSWRVESQCPDGHSSFLHSI